MYVVLKKKFAYSIVIILYAHGGLSEIVFDTVTDYDDDTRVVWQPI